MKTTTFTLIAILFTFNLFAAPISVQGVLRDNDNRAIADGTYTMTFEVFDNQAGGNSVVNLVSRAVVVTNGVYSEVLDLGNTSSSTAELWLEISVASETMSDRLRLHLSPYENLQINGNNNALLASGNVGIGTLSPTEKLDVNGNIKVTGNVDVVGGTLTGNINATGTLTGTLNGNVNGSVSGGAAYVTNGVYTNINNTLYGYQYINSRVVPTEDAYSGQSLGMTSRRFETASIYHITASILVGVSDRRLKSDIADISNGLSVLRQLEPLTYLKAKYLNPADNDDGDFRHEAGLIAQDVAEIPALSRSVSGGGQVQDPSGKYIDTPYGINYNDVFMYGVAAIKELDTKNTTLEEKVAILENTIQSLNDEKIALSNKMNNLENKINSILSTID